MKNVEELRKETSKIKSQIKSDVQIRPVYRLFNAEGKETDVVDIEGNSTEVNETTDVVFKILKSPFRLLTDGKRHTALPHGRDAGISTTIGMYTLGLALFEPVRFLCAREFMESGKKSVYLLLKDLIEADPKLSDFFEVQQNDIYGKNGSHFMFVGVRTSNRNNVKSIERVKYCWGEECQSLSYESLDTLIFTVRHGEARCFWSWNPTKSTDAIHKMFEDERPDTSKAGHPFVLMDNCFTTETMRTEAEMLRQRDPERFNHVVRGGFETRSETRIFSRYIIQAFDLDEVIRELKENVRVGYKGSMGERRERWGREIRKIENGIGVGIDYGVVDPFTIVLTFADPTTKRLFVRHEFYKSGLSPNGMLKAVEEFPLPSRQYPIYADHEPGFTAHLNQGGFNVRPAYKPELYPRTIELMKWDVIIHPECVHTAEEFGLYSWKLDGQGVPIPDTPEDANNHCIDAIFYSQGKKLETRASKGEYRQLKNPFV